MAATVRAVFEIGMPRLSGRSKSIVREERESIATIDRENPVDRQARHPGFGQVRGASGGRPSRNSRSRNRRMEGAILGSRAAARRNRMPVRAPVTEPTESDLRIGYQRQ